jgi:hypothetical protein
MAGPNNPASAIYSPIYSSLTTPNSDGGPHSRRKAPHGRDLIVSNPTSTIYEIW